jgi:8-oxo-dGTP diphosphatase
MYCPQCGTPYSEGDSAAPHDRACLQCGHVVYRQLKVGAGVLVQREGSLLLLKRSATSDAFPGAWNLPAGYCDVDEPPQQAAAREAKEETGLALRIVSLAGVYYFDDDPRGRGVLIVYHADIVDGELPPGGAGACAVAEVADAGFFPPQELPMPLCGGGHDQAIRAWQARVLDRWVPGAALRYCPHCAYPLEVRFAFDRERATCSVCGYVHFRDPKLGVSVLVERDGRVLLVRRAVEPGKGLWCLPSGFVDWDEAPEATAARECLEETGLCVDQLELLQADHYTEDYRGPGINLVYLGKIAAGSLQPGDDATAARFFAPDELPPPEEIAFPGHAETLRRWKARQE